MRQRYVVTYDIGDPKRLRRVFKLMKGWGVHLQYSVFRCDLTAAMLVQLRAELREMINFEEDRVLFVDVGPSDGRGLEVFESLGREDQEPTYEFARVV